MKRLHLAKETLAELSSDELSLVAGGYVLPTFQHCLTGVYPTLPVTACLDPIIVPPTE